MVWKSNCTFPKTQPPIDRCRLTSNFEHCYHFRHNCWLTSSESRSPDSHFSTFLNGTSRVEIFKEKKSTIFGLKIKKKILASSWCDEWPSVGRSILGWNRRMILEIGSVRKSSSHIQMFPAKLLGSGREGEWQSWELEYSGSNFDSATSNVAVLA